MAAYFRRQEHKTTQGLLNSCAEGQGLEALERAKA